MGRPITVIARGLRGPERVNAGARVVTLLLIAGRLDLKPGIVQPLNDDFGRVFGVKDLHRKVGAAEQVSQNVLRGQRAH